MVNSTLFITLTLLVSILLEEQKTGAWVGLNFSEKGEKTDKHM